VGGNDLLIGVTGAAGFIVLIIINLSIFIFDRFMAKESIEVVGLPEFLKDTV
jgi:hypothetical protein